MSVAIFIILVLLILGLAIWAIQSYLPGDPTVKNIICLACALLAIVAIAHRAGLF